MKPRRDPIYRPILNEVGRKVQIHPNYADLQNQFALLLMVEGDMERAEIHFLRALRLNPKYREAILNLGFLYMETKRWKKAEEIFQGWLSSSCLGDLVPANRKAEEGGGTHS
jgi:tetratricopeptide (TPR) repeat protein